MINNYVYVYIQHGRIQEENNGWFQKNVPNPTCRPFYTTSFDQSLHTVNAGGVEGLGIRE